MDRTIGRAMSGQIRSRILAEHAVLRTALDELEALLEAFQHDEQDLGVRLRAHGVELYTAFATHLDVEDAVLVTALRTVEDGEGLATRLERDHREQRHLIRVLLDELRNDSLPMTRVASDLRIFANSLRIDMEHEEVTILREGLIPDR